MYSHPLGPTEKKRKLVSLKKSLLKARNGIRADVEESFASSGLHSNFAKKEGRLK